MHVWAVAVGDCATEGDALTRSLRATVEAYRLLEPTPSWVMAPNRHVFATGVVTAGDAAGARRYVDARATHTTFYSGLPIDPTGSVEAHRADRLALSWSDLSELLEGRFSAVRIAADGSAVDVLLDPLGLEQVFVVENDSGTMLSNSVRVLERAAQLGDLDELGLSLLLAVGWVGGDRTLRAGVRVLPGGRRIRFDASGRRAVTTVHFPRSDLARDQHRRLQVTDTRHVSEALVGAVRVLARDHGRLECPLTGGVDSRLIAAVVTASGTPACYYTVGRDDSPDVVTARLLADRLGLPHRVLAVGDEVITRNWSATAHRLVGMTDGMVSLKDPGTGPVDVDALSVHLHGFGGEIARSFYAGPRRALHLRRPGALDRLAGSWVSDRGGLVTAAARERALVHVRGIVEQWRDRGMRDEDIPDLFYAFERTRRVAGSNLRKRADRVDEVPLLCSRPFIQAAFSVRALSRCAEPLHFELTRELAPALHDLPLARPEHWRPQDPAVLVARAAAGRLGMTGRRRAPDGAPFTTTLGYAKELWVEEVLPEIRDVVLDVSDRTFWEVVDRSRLEHLLTPTTPPATRRSTWRVILAVATAAYYVRSAC